LLDIPPGGDELDELLVYGLDELAAAVPLDEPPLRSSVRHARRRMQTHG